MTLINIDNTMSTYGEIKSVRIENSLVGGRFFEANATETEIMAGVLAVSGPNSTGFDMRSVSATINDLFGGEISLYRAQAVVNGSHFNLCNIEVTVEFAVHTTGHGEIGGMTHHNILLIKTMKVDIFDA